MQSLRWSFACLLGVVSCAQPRAESAAVTPGPSNAPEVTEVTEAAFDPAVAWDEFATLLRANYAYMERADFSVAEQLEHSRKLAMRTSDSEEFRALLHRTTFAFTDPHFIVGPFADSDPNIFPTSSDLVIDLNGDVFIVADVRIDSAADEAGVRPGWTLVSVDDRPVSAAVADIWGGVVLAKTPKQKAYAATLAANGRRVGPRKLGFEIQGAARAVALPNPRDFADAVSGRPLLTVRREGRIGIVRFENSLGEQDLIPAFDQAMEALSDTDGLVLDLRNTPSGGNTDQARAVIGHFVTETRSYQVHEIPAVERATTVPRRFVEQVLPRTPHYPGPVAVLGGRWTGSMGEGLVIGLHAAAGLRTFTSDMGDLLGGLHNFSMEHCDARVDFGAERLLHVDGTPREHYVADVPLASADRDASGADPAMTAALGWLTEALAKRPSSTG